MASAAFAETMPSGIRLLLKELTPEEQTRLAEQFAPVLVFHPEEQYFPANPLFSLRSATRRSWKSLLGTPESRNEAYSNLPLEEKARLGTVFYRAYPAWTDGEPAVVLEYWLYYVHNDYRARGNVLPFWFDAAHPNDLEHIHLVLRTDPSAGEFKYRVDKVYASAHEGKIPANRYQYRDGKHQGPTRFLVELGSHALAPDIDEDGLFTPGTDGDSGAKVLWGIRDRGITWPRYKTSYMTPRSNGNAIVFSHGGTSDVRDTESGTHFAYRLAPVDSLSDRFAQLDLSDGERDHAFETDVFWFNRIFGKDNGRSDKLLVPPRAVVGTKSVGIAGPSSRERIFLVGTVLNAREPGLLAGGRYGFLTSSRYLPDVLFQVDGVVTRKNGYLMPGVLFSYPLDGFTKIMAGKSLVTDSLTFERTQWDWVGAIEVRLGDMRISAAARSSGSVRQSAKEFRLFYAF